MAADVARVRHNNDLFEEGDRRLAHFHHARVEARRAWRRERHQLLLRVLLSVLVLLRVNWFAEVNQVSSDFCLFGARRLRIGVPLCKSVLLCLLVDLLNFGDQSVLLISCLFHSFAFVGSTSLSLS